MSEQNVLADLGAETVLQTLKQSLPFPSNLRHGQRLVTWQFPSAPWTGTIASLGMPDPVTGTNPPPSPPTPERSAWLPSSPGAYSAAAKTGVLEPELSSSNGRWLLPSLTWTQLSTCIHALGSYQAVLYAWICTWYCKGKVPVSFMLPWEGKGTHKLVIIGQRCPELPCLCIVGSGGTEVVQTSSLLSGATFAAGLTRSRPIVTLVKRIGKMSLHSRGHALATGK